MNTFENDLYETPLLADVEELAGGGLLCATGGGVAQQTADP